MSFLRYKKSLIDRRTRPKAFCHERAWRAGSYKINRRIRSSLILGSYGWALYRIDPIPRRIRSVDDIAYETVFFITSLKLILALLLYSHPFANKKNFIPPSTTALKLYHSFITMTAWKMYHSYGRKCVEIIPKIYYVDSTQQYLSICLGRVLYGT